MIEPNECSADAQDETNMDHLRRDVQMGIDQVDHGQFSDFDAESIIAEQRARLERS